MRLMRKEADDKQNNNKEEIEGIKKELEKLNKENKKQGGK